MMRRTRALLLQLFVAFSWVAATAGNDDWTLGTSMIEDDVPESVVRGSRQLGKGKGERWKRERWKGERRMQDVEIRFKVIKVVEIIFE
jgi:hypothetical protein